MSSQPRVVPRVGWGFDAHVLDEHPPLLLGGVTVSEDHGLTATSDGDVLAHAVTDAVLGACVLGDIGDHFPSDDAALDGADSMTMLRQVAAMAAAAGLEVAHLDVTVVAEKIRVAPHRNEIRARLAEALGILPDVISVKATSTDGLGFTGKSEGVAAVAVATVTPTNMHS